MKPYKAVFYDIDGTLLDTINMNLYPLLRIIYEELGEEWDLEDVARFMACPGMQVMEELNIPNKEEVYQRWVRYVNEYDQKATLYPGMEQVLDTFQRHGVRQAIVSSKKRAQYQIDVVEQGLERYFETAVLEEDTFHHKPNPDPLLLCLQRLGLTASETLYVGDTPSDSLAAQAIGMDFSYVKWCSVTQPPAPYATYELDHPTQLLELVDLDWARAGT